MNYKIFKTDLKPWLKKFFFEKFSYIIKTITGTIITITDGIRKKVNELKLSKESSQDGTPSPDNPVEVNTVKGYRNLFDKSSSNYFNTYIGYTSHVITNTENNRFKTIYLPVESGKNYIITKKIGNILFTGTTSVVPYKGLGVNNFSVSSNPLKSIINIPAGENYLIVEVYSDIDYNNNIDVDELLSGLMITDGTEELPYVPYGTNYVYTAVSNGTDTNYYTIPLNGNEIAGIGNYKDELIVDKNGHCWLNKKTGKVVLDGSETVAVSNTGTPNWYYVVVKSMDNYIAGIGMSTHYPLVSISNSNTSQGFNLIGSPKSIRIRYGAEDSPENFKNWLSNNNVEIYDVLATENLIDLNYTVDIELFKGINNISNSDDMDMEIKYYSK